MLEKLYSLQASLQYQLWQEQTGFAILISKQNTNCIIARRIGHFCQKMKIEDQIFISLGKDTCTKVRLWEGSEEI